MKGAGFGRSRGEGLKQLFIVHNENLRKQITLCWSQIIDPVNFGPTKLRTRNTVMVLL